MKLNLTLRLFLAALLLAVCLPSCVLPPRQAWRVIQKEGLVPYVGMVVGKRPIPAYAQTPTASSTGGRTVSAPLPSISLRSELPRNLAPLGRNSSNWATTSYLRTGEPPVIAHRPAPRPSPPVVTPSPAPKVVAAPTQPTLPVRTLPPAPKKVTVAAAPKPAQVEEAVPTGPKKAPTLVTPRTPVANPGLIAASPDRGPVTPSASAPKALMPEPKAAASMPPATEPSVTSEQSLPAQEAMPSGSWVPGRPGLVNSPFAAKHQLVDVNGIAPGETVKCPFSGKLFRVPTSPAPSAATSPPSPPAR